MASLYKPKKLLTVKEGAAIKDSTVKLLDGSNFQGRYVLGTHKKIIKRFLIKSDYRSSVENVVLTGDNRSLFKKSSTFRGQRGFSRKEVMSMLWICGDHRFVKMNSCGIDDVEVWALYEAAYCTGEDVIQYFLDPRNKTSEADKLVVARVLVQRAFESTQFLLSMGMCHRDNKGDNILIDEHGRSQQNDFDLAAKVKNLWEFVSSKGHTAYAPVLLEGEKATIFSKDLPQIGGIGLEGMEAWDLSKDPHEMEGILWARIARGDFSAEVEPFIQFCMACRKINDQKALDHVRTKFKQFVEVDPQSEARFCDVLFPRFKEWASYNLVIPFAHKNLIPTETPFLYDYVSRLLPNQTVEKFFKDVASGKSRGTGKDKKEIDRIIAAINSARLALSDGDEVKKKPVEPVLKVANGIKRLDLRNSKKQTIRSDSSSESESESDSDSDSDAHSDLDSTSVHQSNTSSKSDPDLSDDSTDDVDFDPFDVEYDYPEQPQTSRSFFRVTRARLLHGAAPVGVPKNVNDDVCLDTEGFAIPKTPAKKTKAVPQSKLQSPSPSSSRKIPQAEFSSPSPSTPRKTTRAESPRGSHAPSTCSSPLRSGYNRSSVLESIDGQSTYSPSPAPIRESLQYDEIPLAAQNHYGQIIEFMVSTQNSTQPWFDALAICENRSCRKVLLLPRYETAGRNHHKEVNEYLSRTNRTDKTSAALSTLFTAVSSFKNRTCGFGSKCNHHAIPELDIDE